MCAGVYRIWLQLCYGWTRKAFGAQKFNLLFWFRIWDGSDLRFDDHLITVFPMQSNSKMEVEPFYTTLLRSIIVFLTPTNNWEPSSINVYVETKFTLGCTISNKPHLFSTQEAHGLFGNPQDCCAPHLAIYSGSIWTAANKRLWSHTAKAGW